jgi:CBS domain containing-hemolysin-like protein
MTWAMLLVGMLLAVTGSAGAAVLLTTARSELTEAVTRRLRGSGESFGWLADTEELVVAAMALSSLGVSLVGAAIPGIFHAVTLPRLVLLLVFLVVPAVLLGGYLLPRWLTLPRAGRMVAFLRPVLHGVHAVLGVVLPSGARTTRDDVQAIAREGSASGIGAGEELAMVGGVVTFAERAVREVMTPRTDLVAVAADAPRGEVLTTFAESGYTRLPVYRESLDEIVGMVHAFDFFKLEPGEPLPVRPVAHAPASRSAADLLLDMQRDRRHFAVVLDEFGGTAGVVTLEDLLEALVGEIADEDETEVQARPAVADFLHVDGATSAERVVEYFALTLPDGEATSFAGLLVERLGRIPVAGERFRFAGLDVDVIAASGARIDRLVLRRATPVPVPLEREAR